MLRNNKKKKVICNLELRETAASICGLLADSDAARDRRIMFAACLPDGTLGALCNNVLEPKWSSAGCVSTGLQFVCTVLAICSTVLAICSTVLEPKSAK